ncbi:MAG: hypothetical protein JWN38_584 [Candidatus Saccharibacteria bacterium]|nr:hypothetical protein [Candidatus Saccharibacteria bacterium]
MVELKYSYIAFTTNLTSFSREILKHLNLVFVPHLFISCRRAQQITGSICLIVLFSIMLAMLFIAGLALRMEPSGLAVFHKVFGLRFGITTFSTNLHGIILLLPMLRGQ